MKLTRRDKWYLYNMLDYPINKYLMANSCQRLDGYEKSQRHIEISNIIISFIMIEDIESTVVLNNWKVVHDYLAEILTDRMDEVIGFPIDVPLVGDDMYEPLVKKFFNVIIKHISKIEKIIKGLNNGKSEIK